MTAPVPGVDIAELLRTRRVVVLCGAGGVGKTTTSAALALAAALEGKRVLALTIDPARRLAEVLGLPGHTVRPMSVDPARWRHLGDGREATGAGSLDAWMLDARAVVESLVDRLPIPASSRIRQGRLLASACELVAGMHEYAALEALRRAVEDNAYDLIVLDTPPSRHALDFLDAPRRLQRLLDEGVLRLFGGGSLWQRATRTVFQSLIRLLGEGFVQEFGALLQAVDGGTQLRERVAALESLLRSHQTGFLVVTSTGAEPTADALGLHAGLRERGLPFAGFVLNRSWASMTEASTPSPVLDPAHGWTDRDRGALERLMAGEHARARRDRHALGSLQRVGPARAAPHLGEAIDRLDGLWALAQGLMQPTPQGG